MHSLEPPTKSEGTFDQARIKSLMRDVEKGGELSLVDAVRKQFNLSEHTRPSTMQVKTRSAANLVKDMSLEEKILCGHYSAW